MTGPHEAIVYDLDGTLVDLQVDWAAARADAAAVLDERGVETADLSLWDVLQAADGSPARDPVDEAIGAHEREAARSAERLPLAEELPQSVPVGVCSLNAEAACRIALERHGLDAFVDAVVGRDSLSTFKPDPEPLLEAIRAIGGTPERALFVGDGERDALAAERAGVPFQYAADRLANADDG